jgi:hypothetical protein
MNQLVLLFTAIAFIAGAYGLTSADPTSNSVWLIFFGSAAAALFVYWKNRGEGQGSSSGYGPTSTSDSSSSSTKS